MSPELEKIRKEVARVTRNFSEQDWVRSQQGQWNSALILEHLLLSYTGTTKGLMKALDVGQPLASKPSVRHRVMTFVVTRLGILPSGRTAPRQTTPKGNSPPDSLQKFNDALVAMNASLADAEKRFGKKTKLLDHPIIGPLDAQQWRRVHCAHAMHHLKQMKARSRAAS